MPLPAYIAHRLTVAGGGADRVEFTPEALDLVYNASNGNPRLINLIADKSLHRGHLDRTWTITPAIVTAALGDLGYDAPDPAPDRRVVEGRVPVTPRRALSPDLFLPEILFRNGPSRSHGRGSALPAGRGARTAM